MRHQAKRSERSEIRADARSDPALQEIILERARRAPALQAKGACWYCDEPVDNVRRFCSLACRDDYFEEENELEQK
jgi:hypothetical protein